MTPAEQHFYEDVRAIRKNMNRIADALEAIAEKSNCGKTTVDDVVNRMVKSLNYVSKMTEGDVHE